MKRKQRRARDAALDRLLARLDRRLCTQVVKALDFGRLDAIEGAFVAELEQLIAAGQLPSAPDLQAIEIRAAAMVANALCTVIDERRHKQLVGAIADDDCELCRMAGTSVLVS